MIGYPQKRISGSSGRNFHLVQVMSLKNPRVEHIFSNFGHFGIFFFPKRKYIYREICCLCICRKTDHLVFLHIPYISDRVAGTRTQSLRQIISKNNIVFTYVLAILQVLESSCYDLSVLINLRGPQTHWFCSSVHDWSASAPKTEV